MNDLYEDSGLDDAKEQIKKLEDVISEDNQAISEIANLVAFFHELSSHMSLSLIKMKKKLPFSTRIPEISLWVDIPTILPQTHHLIDIVNQYLLILNSWSFEMDNHDFLRALQSIHLNFEKFLSLSYTSQLNKIAFNKISPVKIVKSENELTDNQTKLRLQKKYSSIFHISDINSIHFTPTIDSVNDLAKNLKFYKNLNTYDALLQIKNELVTSYKELSYLLSDEKICSICDQDFLLNPPYDIIRENPQFQQYLTKISTMLPLIRTEFSNLNNSINNLFTKIKTLNKLLRNSFALPQINFDELNQITTEKTIYYIEKLKIMLLKKTFKEFHNACPEISEFKFPEISLINKIHKKYSALSQTKDIDLIDSQLKKLRADLQNSDFKNVFIEQEKKQISIIKKMEDKIREYKAYQLPKVSNDDLAKIEELQKSVEKLKNIYISERKIINKEIMQSIERHLALFSKNKLKPLFPKEIEEMLQTLSNQAPKYHWLSQRFEMQTEENRKHKETICNLKDNITKLKAEINEKRKLIQSMKANNNTPRIPKTASCLCSSCHAKQVECVITGCGHTFCESCLKNANSCPKCNHHITTNDVCKVYWT